MGQSGVHDPLFRTTAGAAITVVMAAPGRKPNREDQPISAP
ncbi:hypothetical protein STRIP9103_01805 [Streptomyces ipomoeae 91-03]|uniref:Uncharacterized protein n=1 Tax=Streptomyces ipomoeae 91-03 TaxID=698759 RepID=L1KY57_9ACTN|nr:hypothetical protein STRIP9103_01805 [Streptomyces ipomoeae 91-03]